MTPEQSNEALELLRKQYRLQKRAFVVQLVGAAALALLAGMWLYLFMYRA